MRLEGNGCKEWRSSMNAPGTNRTTGKKQQVRKQMT